MATKKTTIFDFIKYLTSNKKKWDTIEDSNKKLFSVFIVNRWLSMETEFIELVNYLQKYTLGVLKPRETYKVYQEYLPNNMGYNKYIKGKKEGKYNPKLIDLYSSHYSISKKETIDNLDLLFKINPNEVETIISKYGLDKKEIKALLKVKK